MTAATLLTRARQLVDRTGYADVNDTAELSACVFEMARFLAELAEFLESNGKES